MGGAQLSRFYDTIGSMWVHLIAIGGTGMGSLAGLLQDQGHVITGSDLPLYPPMSLFLDHRKIPRTTEFSAKNLSGKTWGFSQEFPDLVIVGNAMSRTNDEIGELERLGLRKMSFPEALAHFFIEDRTSVVVAGTHGKTTTSTIMAYALEQLGQKPGFLIGGIPLDFGEGCRMSGGKYFVVEGDEYDTAYFDKKSKFLHYRPSWVLCTGVEFDHADIFRDENHVLESFLELVEKTSAGWLLIHPDDSPKPHLILKLMDRLREKSKKFFLYGKSAKADYRLEIVKPHQLKIHGPDGASGGSGEKSMEIMCPLPGLHNALNTVGVVGVLDQLGFSASQNLFANFKGIKRRQEVIAEKGNLKVIDDFAHHPTAVRETLAALREQYPGRKFHVFFEPRSATSCRKVFETDFGKSFGAADYFYIVPPFKKNVPEDEKLNSTRVAEIAKQSGAQEVFCRTKAGELFQDFMKAQNSSEPTLAVVMSNGDFDGLRDMLKNI